MKLNITALFPSLAGEMVCASNLTARDVLALPSDQRATLESVLKAMVLDAKHCKRHSPETAWGDWGQS